MSDPRPIISVIAPSRLHFGMFSFGQAGVRQFGGVGAMVAPPSLRVAIRPTKCFQIKGLAPQRVQSAVERVCEAFRIPQLPPCEIRVESGFVQHAGLGSGTQLALAVTAGLLAMLGRNIPPAHELALIAGRGRRSAIGTYGFDLGGLILDGGKLSANIISPLVDRVELPANWRFVLVRRNADQGLSGMHERQAFDQMPPVPIDVTDQLCRIATDELLPAAENKRFTDFAMAMGRYNMLAGNCFASIQGGPFNGPRLTQLASALIQLGAPAVGQSSWGPTLFVPQPSQSEAKTFVSVLSTQQWFQQAAVTIAAPMNQGAVIRCETSASHSAG